MAKYIKHEDGGNGMIVKIVFQTNSVPVVYNGVHDVYTKDGLLCLSFDENILKFPLCNIFCIDSDYTGGEWT